MKKARFLLPFVLSLLAGCAQMVNPDDIISSYPAYGTVLPVSPQAAESTRPHPYAVTAQDQEKYDVLTNEIQHRQYSMQQESSNDVPPGQ